MNEPGIGENPPTEEDDLSNLEILLVEDDVTMLRSHIRYLESLGLSENVHPIRDPQEAILRYKELVEEGHKPNMLITDYNMPGKKGLELAQDLLNMDPDLEVLLLTTMSRESLDERNISGIKFSYLSKPEYGNNPDLLKNRVQIAAQSIRSRSKKA